MKTLEASDSLLLLIDWQTRLLPALPYGPRALARACLLARGAGLLSIPVLITEHCADKLGATDSDLIAAATGAQILPKTAFSACADDGLEAALAGKKYMSAKVVVPERIISAAASRVPS